MKRANRWLLLVMAGLATTPAWALPTFGSASITGLGFNLVDLDPDDGVTPSLTWSAPSAYVLVTADHETTFVLNPDGTWSTAYAHSGGATAEDYTTPFTALVLPLVAGYGYSQGAIQADGMAATMLTAANGSSENVTIDVFGEFQLSARTELVVTGVMTANLAGPSSAAFIQPAGTPADFSVFYSQAYVSAYIGLLDLATFSEIDARSVTLSGFNYTAPGIAGNSTAAYQQDAGALPFSLVIANSSGSEMQGALNVRAEASGKQLGNAPAAIPEPATPYLLALGLGAFALLNRSRTG